MLSSIYDSMPGSSLELELPAIVWNGNQSYDVIAIGDGALSEQNIKQITLPNSIISIGDSAFYGNSKLYNISLPNSIKSIGEKAFSECTGLYSASVPNSVSYIGDGAFMGCKSLKYFKLPEYIDSIRANTFYNCNSLVDVYIPNSVKYIGEYAFSECRNLKSVTLPNSLNNIGNYAFKECNALESIYYDTDNPIFAYQDIFSNYSNPILYVNESALDKFINTVPWNLFDKIEPYDFADIDDVINVGDNRKSFQVYYLNGIKVSDDLQNLSPGIYIVRKGTLDKKIIVR